MGKLKKEKTIKLKCSIAQLLSPGFPFHTTVFLEHASVLLFYLGVVFFCYPGLFLDFSHSVIRGNVGDLKNILSIISHSIDTSLESIYHLPILYPESHVLAKTNPLFGISIFFKGFKYLGLTLTQSTNLYIILSLTAGAWGTFLLAKELSNKIFFPLLFSTLYILHPLNHLHFVWLNFLSRFYIPFIFFFFIRYFKTRKKAHAVAAVFFLFLQFLSSVYYGVLLWFVMIPIFLLAALVFKVISLSDLKFPLLCLAIGFLLLLIIFHPYVTHNQNTIKHFDGKLTQVEEFFSVSKVFSLFLGPPRNIKQYLFPGILFTSFVLLFFVSFLPRGKIAAAGALFFFLLWMCYLSYTHRSLLNVVFLVFAVFLVFLVISGRKQMDGWVKLILVICGFMTFFLFHFTYPAVLESTVPFKIFYQLLPVGGLRLFKRTTLMLLPLFVVLASIGASRLFQGVQRLKPHKKQLIFIGLLLLMALENIRNPLLYLAGENGVMKPLPQMSAAYEHLPLNANKVVLEIPFYFRRRMRSKNSYYMINQRHHKNPILNGKAYLSPKAYYNELSRTIGTFQMEFPTEEGLKKLRYDYSVSYIVFHWDLLKKYQQIRRTPVPKTEILRRIKNLAQYAEIIFDSPAYTVLKLRDNRPLTEIAFTYSYYHLKNHTIKIVLSDNYYGSVPVLLNGKPAKVIHFQGSVGELHLKDAPLRKNGNRVTFRFDHSVTISSIDILPY
ncbi:MAG: hypothetical protein JSV88_24215 [Candidatus Aminicenantes bacterium]|nr:MAG: hypothetical protein JSV88_24215 [Candidatus Aminicenantes bacterium]